jgi:xylan 1,4-beta-xylosidase
MAKIEKPLRPRSPWPASWRSACAAAALAAAPAATAFPVEIRIDAGNPAGPLVPIWRFFGADEPNYAYMENGERLLSSLGELRPGEVFFRTHNLLTTGDGTPALKWGSTNAYTEDAAGNPVYDWTIVDRIFETYLARGVKPYVQIGFMPEALSVKPDPYRHHWTPAAKYDEIYTGWAYPPDDWEKWEELVFQWASHCAEKFGREEVLKWYWQTWNEPNIGYWRGTREEFFKLNDHALRAVRRAVPDAKVGGPDVAGGAGGNFLAAFLEHCLRGKNHATGETGTPLDFISFHAKGAPRHIDGRVQMGISNHLRDIDGAFKVIAGFPELKQTPIVIGESDPEGCAACQGPQLAYRNGTMYSSYTAASFARKLDLAAKHGVNLEGALTWAFTFEDQPTFAGFRSLHTNGIDKPVLNVFRMFARMNGERLPVESDAAVTLDDLLKSGVRGKPDVSALAARDGNRIHILAWHYHDDDLSGDPAEITLNLDGAPAGLPTLTRHLIDESHSNGYTAWLAMDLPAAPTPAQLAELQKAAVLHEVGEAGEASVDEGTLTIRFPLNRQGVSLHTLEWE